MIARGSASNAFFVMTACIPQRKPPFTHLTTEIYCQEFSDEEIRLAIAVAKRVEQGKERVFTLEESLADLGL